MTKYRILDRKTALNILTRCRCMGEADFHSLTQDQVAHLLNEADNYGYRAPRNANGSRGRYWFAYLARKAA